MDRLVSKLVLFRDEYVRKYEKSSEDEESQAVRQKAAEIIKNELTSNCHTPRDKAYFMFESGRLLNVAVTYDPLCENLLSSSIKLDSSNAATWFELGQCLAKKPDIEFAVTCFEESLKREKSARTLASLAVALRAKASLQKTSDVERKLLRETALKLAREAVAMDENLGLAHLALGTGCFVEFFSTSQSNIPLLDEAITCYERALHCQDQTANPELHLNFATALRYREDFEASLRHLRQSVALDPRNSLRTKERFEALTTYLNKMIDAVDKKGRLKPKRLQGFVSSLQSTSTGRTTQSTSINRIDQLSPKANTHVVLHSKVVATIPHEDVVPLTMVICDVDEKCCAVTVYNCAPDFGFVIGDMISISEPFLMHSDVFDLESTPAKLNKEEVAEQRVEKKDCPKMLQWIRVRSPRQLLRNGQPITGAVVAPTRLTIES